MIEGATIERFRGIQRLEVDGFGRVNLIIGKNDCGKTALMEALAVADEADAAANVLIATQQRRDPETPVENLERFWLPLFCNQEAPRGLKIATRAPDGSQVQVTLRNAPAPPMVVTSKRPKTAPGRMPWALDVEVVRNGVEQTKQIVRTEMGLQFPSPPNEGGSSWISSSKGITATDIRLFSRMKQTGRDAQLLQVLKEIDGRVSGIDLLAPTGSDAELFVRLGPEVPLLPMAMMGDGFQRCFEMAVQTVEDDWPTLFIDEFDNGLHHSILEPVWRWLATISKQRDLQVFATTHSEECIHAAARAFAALGDDGLRVIRLDRREDRTTAAIYDRDLVDTAMRTGVEIRG